MGKLTRSITQDGCITVMAIDATDIVSQAEAYHQTSAVVTAALGRLLCAASMMGAVLKGKDSSLTLRISSDGPIGSLIAVSDSTGNVRGLAGQNIVEIPLNNKGKLDVGGAVGKGTLYVIKDTGGKEPYVGSIPLVSGEIAEDITAYFAQSEQIPTVCALGVLVNPDLTVRAAGGYLIQLLPTADEEIIERVEASIQDVAPVTEMLCSGLTPFDICQAVLKEFCVEQLDESEVFYRCNCSRERVERALLSIGYDALSELQEQEPATQVECHFCDKTYSFTKEQIQELLKKSASK